MSLERRHGLISSQLRCGDEKQMVDLDVPVPMLVNEISFDDPEKPPDGDI